MVSSHEFIISEERAKEIEMLYQYYGKQKQQN